MIHERGRRLSSQQDCISLALRAPYLSDVARPSIRRESPRFKNRGRVRAAYKRPGAQRAMPLRGIAAGPNHRWLGPAAMPRSGMALCAPGRLYAARTLPRFLIADHVRRTCRAAPGSPGGRQDVVRPAAAIRFAKQHP